MRIIYANCRFIFYTFTLSTIVLIWYSNLIDFTSSSYSDDRIAAIASTINTSLPLIFIGGSYRSGTTLMRVMIDAHPLIRCGQETRILPRFLEFIRKNIAKDSAKLEEAGVTREILNVIASGFITQLIELHGESAPFLCTKDPETLKYTQYLADIYPNAKFILMLRDARATISSVINRKLSAGGYSVHDYRKNLVIWNSLITLMYSQCVNVGQDRCLPVYYEQLVLHPEREMKNILSFLGVPWNEAVLHHEALIGDEIKLAKIELSSDQVVKPVNLEGLNAWFDKIPDDILNEIDVLAPMLKQLGYDTKSKKPNYGEADDKIKENTLKIQENRQYWIQISKNYSNSNFHRFFDTNNI